jgi:hypothetical protein
VSVVGATLIVILLAIAALHLYWGFGGSWPGTDANSLRETVVGTARGPMYGLAACAMVAGALGAAAALVVMRHTIATEGLLRFVVLAGYCVMILVFAGRGLAPYVSPVFEYARGRPFFALNLWMYAPLCLAIAALLVIDFPRGRGGDAG